MVLSARSVSQPSLGDLFVHLVTFKIRGSCTRVGFFIEVLIILEWAQIDEMVAGIIQHSLVRLAFPHKVPIAPVRFVARDRPEFRYLMYQPEH